MLAFVFPGQGSQSRGMGNGLFDEVRQYAALEKEVDAVMGFSVRELCMHDSYKRLNLTQYTQPALYVINALYYYKCLGLGASPQYVAGHSLGEYNALLAAGVFDFLTGLRLVKKRGELMSEAKDGGMAAVIGLNPQGISDVIKENGLSAIDVANFNSPSQTVVSGPLAEINRIGPLFEKAGARLYMPLQVSAAFHSRYVQGAADAFAKFLAPMSFDAPRLPIVANVTGELYPGGQVSEQIKSLLVRQITSAVQWTRIVRFMLAQGVTSIKEVGPGTVLTRLTDQVKADRGA